MKRVDKMQCVDFPGDPIDGTPVEVIGTSGGYPWVRAEDGRTFVWSAERLRRPAGREAQMELKLGGAP